MDTPVGDAHERAFMLAWYVPSSPCCGREVIHYFYDGAETIPCDCGEDLKVPRYRPRGRDPNLILVSEN